MRAMSTMARREGKDGALHFFNFQEQTDVRTLLNREGWGSSGKGGGGAWHDVLGGVFRQMLTMSAMAR